MPARLLNTICGGGKGKKMTEKFLTLTIPPSVNHLYQRRGKRTFKNHHYQSWITENKLRVKKQIMWTDYPCAVSIKIVGGIGWRMNRDLDNTLKAIFDILKAINLIKDDSCKYIQSIAVDYIPPKVKTQDAYAVVRIYKDTQSQTPLIKLWDDLDDSK